MPRVFGYVDYDETEQAKREKERIERVRDDMPMGNISDFVHRDGLIGPDGTFYGCGFEEHTGLSKDMFDCGIIEDDPKNDYYAYFDESGYIKVSDANVYFNYYSSDEKKENVMTKAQIDAIVDFYVREEMTEFKYNECEYGLQEFVDSREV